MIVLENNSLREEHVFFTLFYNTKAGMRSTQDEQAVKALYLTKYRARMRKQKGAKQCAAEVHKGLEKHSGTVQWHSGTVAQWQMPDRTMKMAIRWQGTITPSLRDKQEGN